MIRDLKGNNAWTTKTRTKEVLNLVREMETMEKERKAFLENVPAAMIMSEMDPPRPTTMLISGAYDASGEPVERNTPAFLPAMKKKEGKYTRLDLAEWLWIQTIR